MTEETHVSKPSWGLGACDVSRLSAAPWPAYVQALIRTNKGTIDTVAFGLPRKCASNTMKLAIEQIADTSGYMTTPEMRIWQGTYIAVVREPISRLQAVWRHAVVRNKGQYIKLPADMTWEAFVDHVCATPDVASNYHFRSYSDELIDMTGRMPERTLRCESLQRDFDSLCVDRGWKRVELGRLNATEGPPAEVSEAMALRLRHRYSRDLASFGYAVAGRRHQAPPRRL